MKNKLCFCLSCLFFLTVLPFAQSQDKEDVIEALELILDLSETEALFQHDMLEGETLLIRRPDTRRLNANSLDQVFFELTNDDFRYFSRPVKVVSRNEAQAQDIEDQFLATVSIHFSQQQLRISISSTLREENLFYASQFSLIRETEDDDWKINSKDFQTQKFR